MRWATHMVALIAVAAALAGCAKGCDEAPAEATFGPVAGEAPERFPESGEAPRVVLVEAGSEPRHLLRYHFVEGRKESMAFTMKVRMDVSRGPSRMPQVALPAMQVRSELEIAAVEPDGRARVEITFSDTAVLPDPTIEPVVSAAVASSLRAIEGIEGHAVVNERGVMLESGFRTDALTDPKMKQLVDQMRQSIDQLSAPLPEVPVGVGARWKVLRRVRSSGMTLLQVDAFELTALESDSVSLRLEVEQGAGRQQVESDDVPPGTKTELVSLQTRGSGETRLDLTRLVPRSKAKSESHSVVAVSLGTEEATLDMSMTLEVELAPK